MMVVWTNFYNFVTAFYGAFMWLAKDSVPSVACIYIYTKYLPPSPPPTHKNTTVKTRTHTRSQAQKTHSLSTAKIKLKPEYMKQKFHSCVLLFIAVFLFTSSNTTARILSMKQGEREVVKLDVIADEDSVLEMETTESLDKLMGMEDCQNGDHECFNRRVLAEAHLDYIYTQHHKP